MARSFTDNGTTTTSYVGKATGVVSAIPVSIAAWINGTYALSPVIVQIDDGTNSNLAGIFVGGSSNFVSAQSGAAGVVAKATTTAGVTNNTWSHVAAVFTSITSRAAYLNGANKATNATSNSPAAFSRSSIGSDRVVSDGFNGNIAWLGIWNIALSDQDIATLGQGIHPAKVHPEALVACVDMIGVSPEPDRVSATGWTLGGTGASSVANSPLIYTPRSSWKYASQPVTRSFAGTGTAKVSSSGALAVSRLFPGTATAKVSSSGALTVTRSSFAGTATPAVHSALSPLTISRLFAGTATPAVHATGLLSVGQSFGGSATARVISSAVLTIGRGFQPVQTLKISGFGSFTVIHITPIIPPTSGYYVVLTIEGSYLAIPLIGGLDYSQTIQVLELGPYPDYGTAFQALWTFLNPVFPLADPAEIPAADQFV